MPKFITVMKYRQKRVTVKQILSLVFRILVILEKLFSFLKFFAILPKASMKLSLRCTRFRAICIINADFFFLVISGLALIAAIRKII